LAHSILRELGSLFTSYVELTLIKDKIEKPAPGLFKPGAGFSLKCIQLLKSDANWENFIIHKQQRPV
jgi:hypothetical protein